MGTNQPRLRAVMKASVIPIVPWEVERTIWPKGGGSACAKRTTRKNHRFTCNWVPAVRSVVSSGMSRPVRPYSHLVREFDHRALV